jgi:hypothetical protein
VVLFFGTIF